MSEALTVTDAHKRFGETQALDGARFKLREGGFAALLGPNGAGKTTLIRAIAGRVRLDGGRIDLLGVGVTDGDGAAAEARARLGVVPQELSLYPALTARENLSTFGRLYGVSGAELAQRVRWALDWTGLEGRADERTDGFSGGMRRRLNIAASVLHRPKVVLLDEPTAGVDPQSRQRIWEMLDGLRQEGASLLLTTHLLDEAQQLAEEIWIIDHGKTVASGSLTELVQQTIGSRTTVTFEAEAADGSVERKREEIDDVARDLPALLARQAAEGWEVHNLSVTAPTLHSVFLHLTGKDLRE